MRKRRCLHPAQIPLAAAPVDPRIAVEHLVPVPADRDADAIVVARDRSVVDGDQQHVLGFRARRKNVVTLCMLSLASIHSNPKWLAIPFVQRRLTAIQPVQVVHQLLHAPVRFPFQQVPVEARGHGSIRPTAQIRLP